MIYTKVDNGVWRGPRPVNAAQLKEVRAAFRTVISLEGLVEDAKEQKEFPGKTFLSYPISPLQIYLTGISEEHLDNIVQAIFAARGPVLVHCQHGQDRTGLVIAAYRCHKGWTKAAAMSEALSYGYREWLNYGLNRTWRRYAQ